MILNADLVYLLPATAVLTFALQHSKLFEGLRRYLDTVVSPTRTLLRYLGGCSLCTGFWVGVVLLLILVCVPMLGSFLNLVLTAAGVAYLFSFLPDMLEGEEE